MIVLEEVVRKASENFLLKAELKAAGHRARRPAQFKTVAKL